MKEEHICLSQRFNRRSSGQASLREQLVLANVVAMRLLVEELGQAKRSWPLSRPYRKNSEHSRVKRKDQKNGETNFQVAQGN